ncbi:MAG: type II secretion system protein [Nitrospinae bacterium]|nr:type II secretion system protein [Nitrospinota bacterium]MBF0634809.1 type II secretion system protein [Nitrospinota bacterium]
MRNRKSGFTLPEIALTIVIMAVASLALVAPFMVSSKALGARGPASHLQLSWVAREQAELAMKELSGLSETQWTQTLSALAGASPVTGGTDIPLDEETYRSSLYYVCVGRDLAGADPSCASGFARVTVTLTGLSGGNTLSITFIKTRLGI